jgi:hypothetical protein
LAASVGRIPVHLAATLQPNLKVRDIMTTQIDSIEIKNPDVIAFVTGARAGDVVGKVGYGKILDATPAQLALLARFILSVKALKEASPEAY